MPLLLLIILLLPGVAFAISVDDLVNKGIPPECLAWDNNWVIDPVDPPPEPPPLTGTDFVWVDDTLPANVITGGNEPWVWVNANPMPFSGSFSHLSPLASGLHQHWFKGTSESLTIAAGAVLFTYVWLDPANPPTEIRLQWNDGDWEQRAYWGPYNGRDDVAMRYMGSLPVTGEWVRLNVPAELVGLAGATINGMAFTPTDGRVSFDYAGVNQ